MGVVTLIVCNNFDFVLLYVYEICLLSIVLSRTLSVLGTYLQRHDMMRMPSGLRDLREI